MATARTMNTFGLMDGKLIGADLLDVEFLGTLDAQATAINGVMREYAAATRAIQADTRLTPLGQREALADAKRTALEDLAEIEQAAYGNPSRTIAALRETEARLGRVFDPAVSLRAADQAKAPTEAEVLLRGMREAEVRSALRGLDGTEILALTLAAVQEPGDGPMEFLAAILLAPRLPVPLMSREDAELVARAFAETRWPEQVAAFTQASRLRTYLESNLAQARQLVTVGSAEMPATFAHVAEDEQEGGAVHA